jgi:hypothetical protein
MLVLRDDFHRILRLDTETLRKSSTSSFISHSISVERFRKSRDYISLALHFSRSLLVSIFCCGVTREGAWVE